MAIAQPIGRSTPALWVIILTAIALTVPVAQLGAQERRLSGLVAGGLSVGGTSISPDEPYEALLRGTLGGGVEWLLSDFLALDARALLLRKGAIFTRLDIEPRPENPVDLTVSLRYLAFPVLLKVSAPVALRPYAVIGPEIGIRTSGRMVFTEYGRRIERETFDLDDERHLGRLRRVDVALGAGGGFETRLGTIPLQFEAYASYGLPNIIREQSPEATQPVSIKTKTLVLTAGLRF